MNDHWLENGSLLNWYWIVCQMFSSILMLNIESYLNFIINVKLWRELLVKFESQSCLFFFYQKSSFKIVVKVQSFYQVLFMTYCPHMNVSTLWQTDRRQRGDIMSSIPCTIINESCVCLCVCCASLCLSPCSSRTCACTWLSSFSRPPTVVSVLYQKNERKKRNAVMVSGKGWRLKLLILLWVFSHEEDKQGSYRQYPILNFN